MATVLVRELVEAGVHFGHRASRWNPKMRPYIYGRRNLIHVIDVRETIRGLLRARKYIQQVAGGLVVAGEFYAELWPYERDRTSLLLRLRVDGQQEACEYNQTY